MVISREGRRSVTGWTGIVNIAKPADITSRDAVDRVKRWVKPAKIGHAGTLDPLATGVLLIAVGSATRLVAHLQQLPKTYRAAFRLGETSDSDDVTGAIISRQDASAISREQVLAALNACVGTILQTPPQVSAVHVAGRRAYALARQGVEFELQPRPVDVYSMQLLDWAPPEFSIEMTCGSGTYVRSIGRDVGMTLGCGALMTSLVRTAIGPFTLHKALPIEHLSRDVVSQALQPAVAAVPKLPKVTVNDLEERAIRCGQTVPLPRELSLSAGQELAWVDAVGCLVGIGAVTATDHRVQPRIVLPRDV